MRKDGGEEGKMHSDNDEAKALDVLASNSTG